MPLSLYRSRYFLTILNKNRLSQHFEIIDPISSESRILLIFIFDFESVILRSKQLSSIKVNVKAYIRSNILIY